MHWATALEVYGEKLGIRRMRTHAIKYAQIHPRPIEVREAFVKIRTPVDFENVLESDYRENSATTAG